MLKKITMAALCLFLLTASACSSGNDEQSPQQDNQTDVENNTQETEDNKVSTNGDIDLTSYQIQSVVSSINNKLSEMYEIGTYGWVSADSISLSRDKDGNLVASTSVNRTDNGQQYSVPAEFTLIFDHSSNTYSVKEEEVNDDNKEVINKDDKTTSSSSSSSNPPTDMSEQDSFEIDVNSGFTITLDTSNGGKGAAYAQSEDGKYTLICEADSEEKTGDVSLPAGHYTIHLYAEEGTHWSWSYNAY